MWVCETLDYPNELNRSGQGRDRIRICEGRDQDGVETLYLKDTDGDDKADVWKVLISDWELGDTHGGVSNFRYGHDNWFWAMQGYNHSAPRIGKNRPQQQRFRMGFFWSKLELHIMYSC
ncbi:MAG: hypothetical protein KDB27_28960 [Planctomycetales bacterium]|nr:hypothetical protein [Planctomycetales bacterium]